MKIGIIGWGSLIWQPKELNFDTAIGWIKDGPILPIEFSRISNDGRLTLVITPHGQEVPALYAISGYRTIEEARNNLAEREGTGSGKIGVYDRGANTFSNLEFPFKKNILEWIENTDIDAVIWTNLPENWQEKTRDRIEYLRTLNEERAIRASEYIINAPEQISTPLREEIEKQLGW